MTNDAEIARNVIEELRWTPELDDKDIAVKVTDGVVALTGFVNAMPERAAAERAAKRVAGVRPIAADIHEQIAAAFKRSAQIDANNVSVEINGPEVTLSGKVHSWAEHEAAAEIAWCAPGVTQVKNHICVGP
jgi:osmotically-inducible protein OsmY